MKKFIIDDEVFEILPSLNAGVLVLENVCENKKMSKEKAKNLEEMLKKANKEAKKYVTNEVISENEVVKVWRETYSKFPTKKGARCSLENLLKRVLHDNPVGSILPSVDITNSISLKYAFPIGAEDVLKLEGDLHLAVMNGDEKFIPIGYMDNESPLKGEIAYKDDYGCVCRCLNWRDGVRTQISDDTNYEFIVMECVEEDRIDDLKKALDELGNLMCEYLDAKIVIKEIVNKDKRELVIK